MTLAERLQHITMLVQSIEDFGRDPEAQRERRIKAIYGRLGIERPDLTLREVRRVLASSVTHRKQGNRPQSASRDACSPAS